MPSHFARIPTSSTSTTTSKLEAMPASDIQAALSGLSRLGRRRPPSFPPAYLSATGR